MDCHSSSNFPTDCRCSFDPPGAMMVHVGQSSYYKGMGLIRDRGSLYVMPLPWAGVHFSYKMVKSIDREGVKHFYSGVTKYGFITIRYDPHPGRFRNSMAILLQDQRLGKNLVSHLRRIQRVVRAFVRARMEERYTALAMSLHPRLGNRSALSCLCSDMLQKVLIPGRQ